MRDNPTQLGFRFGLGFGCGLLVAGIIWTIFVLVLISLLFR